MPDRQEQRHTLSSSGNYNSTLALSRSGLWLGRWSDGRPASAVAVNVATPEDSQDPRVAVSLDNGGSADIPGNSRALFAVPGYQQTTLTINESLDVSQGASSEITQGSGSRTLFMVPENCCVGTYKPPQVTLARPVNRRASRAVYRRRAA